MRRMLGVALLLALVAAVAAHAQTIAIGGIHLYQHTLAPIAAHAGARCRMAPSCSHYAEAVIARDGVIAGGWKSARRLLKCGPWTTDGTIDLP
jgi:uncharacterized protein